MEWTTEQLAGERPPREEGSTGALSEADMRTGTGLEGQGCAEDGRE